MERSLQGSSSLPPLPALQSTVAAMMTTTTTTNDPTPPPPPNYHFFNDNDTLTVIEATTVASYLQNVRIALKDLVSRPSPVTYSSLDAKQIDIELKHFFLNPLNEAAAVTTFGRSSSSSSSSTLRTRQEHPEPTRYNTIVLVKRLGTIAKFIRLLLVEAVGDKFNRNVGIAKHILLSITQALCHVAEAAETAAEANGAMYVGDEAMVARANMLYESTIDCSSPAWRNFDIAVLGTMIFGTMHALSNCTRMPFPVLEEVWKSLGRLAKQCRSPSRGPHRTMYRVLVLPVPLVQKAITSLLLVSKSWLQYHLGLFEKRMSDVSSHGSATEYPPREDSSLCSTKLWAWVAIELLELPTSAEMPLPCRSQLFGVLLTMRGMVAVLPSSLIQEYGPEDAWSETESWRRDAASCAERALVSCATTGGARNARPSPVLCCALETCKPVNEQGFGAACFNAGKELIATKVALEESQRKCDDARVQCQQSLAKHKAEEAEQDEICCHNEGLRDDIAGIPLTSQRNQDRFNTVCDGLSKRRDRLLRNEESIIARRAEEEGRVSVLMADRKKKTQTRQETLKQRTESKEQLRKECDVKRKGVNETLLGIVNLHQPSQVQLDQIELRLQTELEAVKDKVAANAQIAATAELSERGLVPLKAQKMDCENKLKDLELSIAAGEAKSNEQVLAIANLQDELARVDSEMQAKHKQRSGDAEAASLAYLIKSTKRQTGLCTDKSNRLSRTVEGMQAELAVNKASHTKHVNHVQSTLSDLDAEWKETSKRLADLQVVMANQRAALQERRSVVKADRQHAEKQIAEKLDHHPEFKHLKIEYYPDLDDEQQARIDLEELLATNKRRRKAARKKLADLEDEERRREELSQRASQNVGNNAVDLVSKRQRQVLKTLALNGDDAANDVHPGSRLLRFDVANEARDGRGRLSTTQHSGHLTRRSVTEENLALDRVEWRPAKGSATSGRGPNEEPPRRKIHRQSETSGNVNPAIFGRTYAIQAPSFALSCQDGDDMHEFDGHVDLDTEEADDATLDSEVGPKAQSQERIVVWVGKENTKHKPGNILFGETILARSAEHQEADVDRQKEIVEEIAGQFAWRSEQTLHALELKGVVKKKIRSAFSLAKG